MRTHHRGFACATPPNKTRLSAQEHREGLKSLEYPPASLLISSAFFRESKLTSPIMVNPLLILPLLNASTLTTTTDGCYEQNRPGQTQRVSTTYTVCSQAINRMAAGRALDKPLNFGRTVKVGHSLPDQFVQKGFYGTCVVEIDMKDGEQDTMTWRDILVSASTLRDLCVATPPHLGGEGKAGPRQLLDVVMYGLSKEVDLALPVGSSGLVQGRDFDA